MGEIEPIRSTNSHPSNTKENKLMDTQKGFITRFGEWWDDSRLIAARPHPESGRPVGLPAGCPPAAT